MNNFLKFINDFDEFLFHFFIFISFIIVSILVFKWLDNIQSTHEEIIKNSNGFIIYKDCTKIENVYYCKDLVED